MNKQWPNDSIPLCFKPKNTRMQRTDSGQPTTPMTDQGTALELLPSTLTHTQEQGLKGGYASIKRTLILLVKIRLEREEQKQVRSSLCNALRPNLLRKLENDVSLLFLLGISAGTIEEKWDSSQENSL